MSDIALPDAEERWSRLVKAHMDYNEAFRHFMSVPDFRLKLVKKGLQKGDRATAMMVIPFLQSEELPDLFEELLNLACYSYGYGKAARDAILAMPKEWVMSRIEQAVEPYLNAEAYDVYRAVLELYLHLDQQLAYELASRAASHKDSDIKEAGEDYLERLSALNTDHSR